jgi:hypothetical protein
VFCHGLRHRLPTRCGCPRTGHRGRLVGDAGPRRVHQLRPVRGCRTPVVPGPRAATRGDYWPARHRAVVFPRQLIAPFTGASDRRNQLAGRVKRDEERSAGGRGWAGACWRWVAAPDDASISAGAPPVPTPGEPLHVRGRSNGGDQLESGAGTPPGGGDREAWGGNWIRVGASVRQVVRVGLRDLPPRRPRRGRPGQRHTPRPGNADSRVHAASSALNKYRTRTRSERTL